MDKGIGQSSDVKVSAISWTKYLSVIHTVNTEAHTALLQEAIISISSKS